MFNRGIISTQHVTNALKGNFSKALAVTYVSLDLLSPHLNNARIHSKQQVRQIASSIKAFGFCNPILIDNSNTIVAGHGRVAAAKLLGMRDVPAIRLEGLTQTEIRAYIIADNRLAEKAGWDKAILAIELQHITLDADFDVTITGFEVPEIDLIIEEAKNTKPDEDDVFSIDDTDVSFCCRSSRQLFFCCGSGHLSRAPSRSSQAL